MNIWVLTHLRGSCRRADPGESICIRQPQVGLKLLPERSLNEDFRHTEALLPQPWARRLSATSPSVLGKRYHFHEASGQEESGSSALGQGPADFLCRRSDSKHFSPWDRIVSVANTQLCHCSRKQPQTMVNEWVWLRANKTLFTGTEILISWNFHMSRDSIHFFWTTEKCKRHS